MTCSDQQVKWLRTMIKKHTQKKAASASEMSAKTARKYLKTNKLPSEFKKAYSPREKRHALYDAWPEVMALLNQAPKLHAKTILSYLIDKYGNKYKSNYLRSLHRMILKWRREEGPDKEIIFQQDIKPGCQSQSDFTNMNDLNITIAEQQFSHLLFHFMLPYSRWEYVSICHSESLESLSKGYDDAVWTLGGVAPEHRTDNLSAAVHCSRSKKQVTDNWRTIMDHYNVQPSFNNAGKGHENGSVEKSHDLIKSGVDQLLSIRGSRNFSTINEYRDFLEKIIAKRNSERQKLVEIELALLKPLPESRFYAPEIIDVTVSKFSTVRLLKSNYSVPSRLIGCRVRAYIYHNNVRLFYGEQLIQEMPKIESGQSSINYRHMIASLVRKPGAFTNYCYKESFFPTPLYRRAYDLLKGRFLVNHNKQYLQILFLAATEGELRVEKILDKLLSDKIVPEVDRVKALLTPQKKIPEVQVTMPLLQQYDTLIRGAHEYR